MQSEFVRMIDTFVSVEQKYVPNYAPRFCTFEKRALFLENVLQDVCDSVRAQELISFRDFH